MSGALSQLPIGTPHVGAPGVSKLVAVIKRNKKPAKPVASIPKMKAVAKLAEKLGKSVTGITVLPDGSFTIATSDPEKAEEAKWWNDKVFGND